MSSRRWEFADVRSVKPQGFVWVVKGTDGARGYFKFGGAARYRGTAIANELIAAALARLVGLPAASVELAVVRGPDGVHRRGLVSPQIKASHVLPWSDAPPMVHAFPRRYVADCRLLAGVTVFDAWILNVDRADGGNLILWRNHLDKRYRWYLIDHALTLWGARAKWDGRPWGSPVWRHLWEFYHVPHGLLQIQQSWRMLAPMIRRIESLTRREIRTAVNTAPSKYMGRRVRRFTLHLLLARRRQLRPIVKRWLEYRGTKEYAGENLPATRS